MFIQTCHRVHSAFFCVFFFRLEYPLRRIFWRRRTGAGRPDGPIQLANSPKWGLGGSAARSSWYGHPPAAPGTRADEGGGPSQGFLYGCYFYLKWRWALNQEITDSAAQQGWCPRSAACNSWCIHHPAVCDGRMCTAGTWAGRADGPIWLKNSPKQGPRGGFI